MCESIVCRVNLLAHKQFSLHNMGWLTKIIKGSSHKISKGQYQSTYGDERIWDGPSTMVFLNFLVSFDAVIFVLLILCMCHSIDLVCFLIVAREMMWCKCSEVALLFIHDFPALSQILFSYALYYVFGGICM